MSDLTICGFHSARLVCDACVDKRIAALEAQLDVFNKGGFKDADALAARFIELTADLARVEADRDALTDALREIAFMGMDVPAAAGGGDEARDRMHAQQAWRAISIASRALEAARTQGKGPTGDASRRPGR